MAKHGVNAIRVKPVFNLRTMAQVYGRDGVQVVANRRIKSRGRARKTVTTGNSTVPM